MDEWLGVRLDVGMDNWLIQIILLIILDDFACSGFCKKNSFQIGTSYKVSQSRHNLTDRQTNAQTHRHTHTYTHRERERERERGGERERKRKR